MREHIDETLDILEAIWVTLRELWSIVTTWLPRLARAAANARPDDVQEWRAAYTYFWVPLAGLVIGVIVAVSIAWLLPAPLNWICCTLWVIRVFIAEPLQYFVYGNGWEAKDHYVRTGEYRYEETE